MIGRLTAAIAVLMITTGAMAQGWVDVNSGSIGITNNVAVNVTNAVTSDINGGTISVTNTANVNVTNAVSANVSGNTVSVTNTVNTASGNTIAVTNSPAVTVTSGNITIGNGATLAVTNTAAVTVTSGSITTDAGAIRNVTNRVTVIDSFYAIPAGLIPGQSAVNKFGQSDNVDTDTPTDIWDGANLITDQAVWIAPSQARAHNISSSSVTDSNSASGARTMRVFGLTNWANNEVSEDVTMLGTNVVATANSYVIIHRMRVLTKGTNSSNLGQIEAVAQVDNSITAMVRTNAGQTLMAIYGVPSTKTAYMPSFYAAFNVSGGATTKTDIDLLVNPEPDVSRETFLTKNVQGLMNTGSSHLQHWFKPYFKIAGPAIIKVRATGGAADQDVSAGFDLILVDN